MTDVPMMSRWRKMAAAGLLSLLWLAGCSDPNTVYKQYTDIESGTWFAKNEPAFAFDIQDAAVPYNLYYNVRNAVSYPYYNLYLTRYLKDPAGRTIDSRLDELLLMDAKTGKPLGDGLGDLFDHQVLMKRNYRFPKPGRYTITLRQYMRQDPLPDVLSVGVTVERAK
jgi:gliding motility-associated lipoprotein GldH